MQSIIGAYEQFLRGVMFGGMHLAPMMDSARNVTRTCMVRAAPQLLKVIGYEASSTAEIRRGLPGEARGRGGTIRISKVFLSKLALTVSSSFVLIRLHRELGSWGLIISVQK